MNAMAQQAKVRTLDVDTKCLCCSNNNNSDNNNAGRIFRNKCKHKQHTNVYTKGNAKKSTQKNENMFMEF